MSGIKYCDMAQSARSALPWFDKVAKFQSHPKVFDVSWWLPYSPESWCPCLTHWHHPALSAEDWILEGNTESCPYTEVAEKNSAYQNPPAKNDWNFWIPQLTPLNIKNTTLLNDMEGFCAGSPHPGMGGSSELVCWSPGGRTALFAQWSHGWLSLPGSRSGKFKCCVLFMHLLLWRISLQAHLNLKF